MVTRRVLQVELDTQVALGGLNRLVAQAELDLLEAGAALERQLGERPPAVVRRHVELERRGVGEDDVGDRVRAHAPAVGQVVAPAQRAKHAAVGEAGQQRPAVDQHPGPGRHRHRAHAVALADDVDDGPAAVALLQVAERERGQLAAAQAAAEQHGQDGLVAHALEGGGVRRIQQRLGLGLRQPVADACPGRLDPFDLADTSGQLGVDQVVVGGFLGQGADGAQALVDRRRRQAGVHRARRGSAGRSLCRSAPRAGVHTK